MMHIQLTNNEVTTLSTNNNLVGSDSSDDEHMLEEISSCDEDMCTRYEDHIDSDLYGDCDDEYSSPSFK